MLQALFDVQTMQQLAITTKAIVINITSAAQLDRSRVLQGDRPKAAPMAAQLPCNNHKSHQLPYR